MIPRHSSTRAPAPRVWGRSTWTLWGVGLAAVVPFAAASSVLANPPDGPRLQATEPAPPSTVEEAVCRPVLRVDGRDRKTGTAFVLQIGAPAQKLLLVMAHHLFGMKGPDEIPWPEMPARARSATCRSIAGRGAWTAGPAQAIDGAHAILPVLSAPAQGAQRQSAAFRLAPDPPRPGERVWLVAQLADPARAAQHLYAATVIPTQGFLAYVYQDEALDLSNTSGAPIVDAAGDVVGVNVGVAHQDHMTIGVGDDLATIRAAIADKAAP